MYAVAMIMFSSFEHSVDFIYDKILHERKMDCSKGVQLGVTAAAGYASGVAGSIVSNPADNIITYIYNNKGHTFSQSLKAVGWVGLLTRSLPLRLMLVGPLVTVQWFCVDSLKILMGLPPSGGIEHQMFE
jgi:solute carrier family 25 phosphate transporter 3